MPGDGKKTRLEKLVTLLQGMANCNTDCTTQAAAPSQSETLPVRTLRLAPNTALW